MARQNDVDHPIVAALHDALVPMEWVLTPHRRYLARNLSGHVLDLGSGTGPMFEYVAEQAITDDPISFHAVEPDPNMRRRAARTANALALDVDLRDGNAESLPFSDDSFDVVFSSMVFCTIKAPDAALSEVARVLKPGGELRFLEHVRADGWRQIGQTLLEPVWSRVTGGCHLTRRTVERFVCHEGFDVVHLERIGFGVFPATPFLRGRVRRRSGT